MVDTAADVGNLSLAAAYDRVNELLDGPDGTSAASPDTAQEALQVLSHCELLVQRAALFSSNEDADDLITSQLKYLLVPFLQAELHSSLPSRDPAARLRHAQAASEGYCGYLQRCQQYGLLRGPLAQAYAAEEAGSAGDPGTARVQRIERFKRSRALAGLLQQMRGRRRQADEEGGTEGGPPGGVGGWDEEDERRLMLLQLEAAAIKALDSRPTLRQEQQLLQHAVALQQSSGSSSQQQQQGSSSSFRDAARQDQQQQQQRQQLQHQMFDKLAGIAGQLSLTGDRQAIRQQVFRPSHILPTLSVEQQGAIEFAQAQQREARQAQAAAAEAARKAALTADEADEEEVARARAWDDFADDNPRGWGNSKLRPCA
uniref:TAP42-like protein n=1 Tax=Tetradesmus obliquus TaxID=3088 RepID=A0A383VIK6_TETOB|eukprot:jgi/Sobl393_1/18439/SZX64216.1